MSSSKKNNLQKFFDLPQAKLIIFDCDGVLVDGETLAMNAIIKFAKLNGFNMTEEMTQEYCLGHALPQVVENLSKLSGKAFPKDSVEQLRKMFIDLAEEHAEPVSGVAGLLKRMNEANISFRVGSNSSAKEMKVKFKASGLEGHIEDENIHSAADIGAPKPNPDVYLLAAKEEGVRPEECIVIEDSNPGALAAVRAGMRCIVLRPANEPVPPAFEQGNCLIAHDVAEIEKFIFKAAKGQ